MTDPQPRYCGSPGLGLTEVIRAAVGTPPRLPDWFQVHGADAIPLYRGRVAIWHLCRAWKIGPGDEVLVPAYNCGAEIDPFVKTGATVILYRVGMDCAVDIDDVILRLTRRTRVLFVTHYFGWPQDLEPLIHLCRNRGIALVEDCAHALFSMSTGGAAIGSMGDAAVFSFTKFLPVPDGGALVLRRSNVPPTTGHPPALRTSMDCLPLVKGGALRLAERLGIYAPARRLRMRWPSLDGASESTAEAPDDIPPDYYLEQGTAKWAMSTIALRLLSGAEPRMITQTRRSNYTKLLESLRDLPHVIPLMRSLDARVCPLGLPLRVRRREAWAARLHIRGIAAFSFWRGYHRGFSWCDFPEARLLKDDVLVLPVHQALDDNHLAFIAASMREVCRQLGG